MDRKESSDDEKQGGPCHFLLRRKSAPPFLCRQQWARPTWRPLPAEFPERTTAGRTFVESPGLKWAPPHPEATARPSEATVSNLQQFRSQGVETPCERTTWGTRFRHPHQAPLTRGRHETHNSWTHPSHGPYAPLPPPVSRRPRFLDRKNLYQSIRLERWAGRRQKGRNKQQLHAQTSDPAIPLRGICAINTLLCEHKDGCSLQHCLVTMSYVRRVWTECQ